MHPKSRPGCLALAGWRAAAIKRQWLFLAVGVPLATQITTSQTGWDAAVRGDFQGTCSLGKATGATKPLLRPLCSRSTTIHAVDHNTRSPHHIARTSHLARVSHKENITVWAKLSPFAIAGLAKGATLATVLKSPPSSTSILGRLAASQRLLSCPRRPEHDERGRRIAVPLRVTGQQ